MNSQPDQTVKLQNRFDLLTMFVSVLTLLLVLSGDPWWTLTGTTVNRLMTIQLSPFYARIAATGLPPTVPYADTLGSFTRVFLLLGFLALFAASLRPKAWWRNLTLYFGVSSLAELYLSFILVFYWTQTAFVNAYGITTPYYGTSRVQANILGLDLAYYPTPQLTATFGLLYHLGIFSLAMLLGRSLMSVVLGDRALRILSDLPPSTGIHDVYLTPPYQNVWLSSTGEELNPLRVNPEGLTDDELLVSFEKVYRTVEPGGILSITLPTDAATLTSRLERLMPLTGFIVEKTETTEGSNGETENQLHFRKPLKQQAPLAEQAKATEAREASTVIVEIPQPAPVALPMVQVKPASPPVLNVVAGPVWVPRMTRIERTILRAAVKQILDRREPIGYRQLINQVYMELVDRKTEFDSARQIETTLLNHDGKELVLVEETDQPTGRIVKKWWLGQQRLRGEKVSRIGPKLRSFKSVFRRSRKSGYKTRNKADTDTSTDSRT